MRDECIYDVCVHDEEGISYEIHITWRIDEARATLRQRSEAVSWRSAGRNRERSRDVVHV